MGGIVTTTTQRRRIEVLVDAPLLRLVVDAAQAAGVSGYTVLPTLSGSGRHGSWSDDQLTGAQAKLLFLAVASDDKAQRLLDQLAPLLESHGLVVLSSPVEVIRADRF
jgi:PII-like signaling protein